MTSHCASACHMMVGRRGLVTQAGKRMWHSSGSVMLDALALPYIHTQEHIHRKGKPLLP